VWTFSDVHSSYRIIIDIWKLQKKENININYSDGEKTTEQKIWLDAVSKYISHDNAYRYTLLWSSPKLIFVFYDLY